MIVFADGNLRGTVGGGKFESLVVSAALQVLDDGVPRLQNFPLREDRPDSFGAICGGEVTIFLEPFPAPRRLILVGAGHCAQAVARLAAECGFHVTALDDREDILGQCTAAVSRQTTPAPEYLAGHRWTKQDALVIVSRHYDIDRMALASALAVGGFGYLGMIGSRRKVLRVFDQLRAEGLAAEALASVHAPLGLDIGADAPAEIAVSIMAEVLQVLNGRPGGSLRIPPG